MKLQKIKFLSDQPLAGDKEQEVHFGHIDIANSLKEIVLDCPLPFTIGLFGRWGSGKTTIINILEKKLQDDKVATVNFDVWKHEGDPLRRAFLKELSRQLKETTCLPKDFELSERLESSVQTTREIKKIPWNRKVWSFLLIFIVAIVGIGVFLYFRLPHAFGTFH
jgi:predicted KAP-like P-loop ATPase